MRLLQLQFGGILNRDDALPGRDETGERVEQRGLARAGAAGDDDVEPRLDRGLQQRHHPAGQRPLLHQVFRHQLIRAEAADRKQRTIHRQRRDDGVDPRAVAQARIHHGIRFVHPPPHLADDPVDDAQQVGVIVKLHIGQLEPAASLHVDLAVAVHQDVADGWVLEQWLERSQAEDLVQHLVADLLLLGGGQQVGLVFEQRENRLPDLGANAFVIDSGQGLQIDPVQQLSMEREFQVLILGLNRCAGGGIAQQPLPSGFRCNLRRCTHRASLSLAKTDTVLTIPR